ncbi:MAG: hypothetical protein KJ000_01745 [Pirellulaceae bacterium]|nr:hypothetical protein [Pirellulaceae bacterium]
MKIPKYWAKAEAEETDREGRKIAVSCWRWADESQSQAQQAALAAAKRAVASLLRGDRLDHYAYGQTPLREEVLNELRDATGEPLVAVTRNRYGAIVLNTARAAFIDMDFPPATAAATVRSLFTRWWGKPAASPESQQEAEIWTRLEQYAAERPERGFRVYRTCAGVRALATGDLFDPASPTTLAMLERLQADPLYVRLCKGQGCFRARLSPKPWRCGCEPNRVAWPREEPAPQTLFERWEAQYAASQESYATCRLLGTIGNPRVHPELEPIIQLHDHLTRCQQDKPLA